MFEKNLIANRGDQLPAGSTATKLNCVVAASHAAIETRSK